MKDINMDLDTSHWIFLLIVFLLIFQRMAELRLSNKNQKLLKKKGARESGAAHFFWMKLIHSFWFVSMILEILVFRPVFELPVFLVFLGLLFTGQFLRYSAILTLKERWTVRIFTLPGVRVVDSGIFKWIRHPNYLGVCIEIFAIPMMHSAWMTAVIFSLLNGFLLIVRIKAEESALREDSGLS